MAAVQTGDEREDLAHGSHGEHVEGEVDEFLVAEGGGQEGPPSALVHGCGADGGVLLQLVCESLVVGCCRVYPEAEGDGV